MDISDTDTQESDVANGKVFYKGTGARSVGTANLDSAVWGNITGTLSNQTDLQNALDAKMSYADNGVLGAKNLLPNTASTQTINGVTFTVNSDGSVNANGTATNNTAFPLNLNVTDLIIGESYIWSGCPSGGGDITYQIRIGKKSSASDTWGTKIGMDSGNGLQITIPQNDYGFVVHIYIANGQTVNNLTFYPMLRLASDPDDTYAPYAMTNKELTDSKANTSDLDGWTATSQVANGEVSFSGLDDTQGWGYFPCFWVDGNSTNLNPVATIKTITGAGTASMSVTYETDADNGASCKLRIEK